MFGGEGFRKVVDSVNYLIKQTPGKVIIVVVPAGVAAVWAGWMGVPIAISVLTEAAVLGGGYVMFKFTRPPKE